MAYSARNINYSFLPYLLVEIVASIRRPENDNPVILLETTNIGTSSYLLYIMLLN